MTKTGQILNGAEALALYDEYTEAIALIDQAIEILKAINVDVIPFSKSRIDQALGELEVVLDRIYYEDERARFK